MPGLTRFEELFGDEAFNFSTTPTLSDVAPGLISSDTKYASKELNRGRGAATGRSFRSPVPRSLNPRQVSANVETPPVDMVEEDGMWGWKYSNPPSPEESSGPGGGEPETNAASTLSNRMRSDYRGADGGRQSAGLATGDLIATQLGTIGLAGALGTAAAGIGLEASAGQIASAIPGGFISAALNPFAVANVVGGGLVAGQMGHSAAQTASTGYGGNVQGTTANPAATGRAGAAAVNAASSPAGLIGMGVQGLASLLSENINSPTENAMAAAGQEIASSGMLSDAHMATESGLVSNAPGHSAGDEAMSPQADFEGINADVNAAEAASSSILGPEGIIASGLASIGLDATRGVGVGGSIDAEGMTHGFVQSGLAPHASEFGLGVAPTVDGVQGHGTGIADASPTGRGDKGKGKGRGRGGSGRGTGDSGIDGGIGGGVDSPAGGGAMGLDGGGGGGGGGTVICTELYNQGIMSEELYDKDVEFAETIPEHVLEGYRLWGTCVAAIMSKSAIATWLLKYPALAWARHMAGEPNWFGKIAMAVGIPACSLIGKLKRR